MRSDAEVKRDVEAELKWDVNLQDASGIVVTVKDGVVTLTGFVRSWMDRYYAERAAKRVAGVRGLANDLDVRLAALDERPDPEIAQDAVAAIERELPLTSDRIQVVVRDGVVTLEGSVEWNFQKEWAEKAVRKLPGIKSIANKIEVEPVVSPTDLKRKIEDALVRSAQLDADRIKVEAKGSEVVLRGTVRSWAERQEAERAAWAAPGVAKVDNELVVAA